MKIWTRTFVFVLLAGYVGIAQQAVPKTPPATAPAARSTTARLLPTATAETVGVSSPRLERLHKGMQGYVDRREAAGIVTLIARDGKVVDVHASGFQDIDSRKAMQVDTIFRIASMTKPITSVAIMMLFEEGKLFLTDPVSKFIPAFKGSTVIEDGKPVPARRAITIRDLLAHKSGITYGFLNGGAVGGGYRKNGVTDGLTSTTLTLEENVNKLAAEPLVSQPGDRFNYSLSTDVLARVVEVVSGQAFDVFLRERIFRPLKMVDTDFVVPDAKWSRFVTVYSPDGKGGIRPMTDPETFGNTNMSPWALYKTGRTYFSGGAGLASTASDYARFANMLLNGGIYDGARLLSPKTVELMTMSHTSELTPPLPLLGPGNNFGLGFRVVTDIAATQSLGSNGLYGWIGIYGTAFWVDPKERLVAVMLVQKYPNPTVTATFQTLVYQALVR
jgi:CubicO group peptidase (beta-lactamase class C family)